MNAHSADLHNNLFNFGESQWIHAEKLLLDAEHIHIVIAALFLIGISLFVSECECVCVCLPII